MGHSGQLLTPVVNAQNILLLAGHLHRAESGFLSTVSKSSAYLSGISNHLAATSPRVRFLGMVVGSTISEILDEPGKQLQFKAEDSDSAEWRWYKELISMNDRLGTIADLRLNNVSSNRAVKKTTESSSSRSKPSSAQKLQPSSKIVKIEEIEDSSESEEDDLPVYAKRDSDPSDDDEDPELVQRNKPTAPV